MLALTVSLAVCTLLVHVTSTTDTTGIIAETVPVLNISQYLGTWYQVYGSYDSETREQRGCVCVSINYSLLPNKSISVQNSCRNRTGDGEARIAKFLAYRPDDNEQGKFKLAFARQIRPLDYWVIQLGPPTFNGNLYQYAVVTTKCKLNLFVIVRDIAEFKRSYEEEVLAKLKELGFTHFHNKPIEIYQESDCEYIQVMSNN